MNATIWGRWVARLFQQRRRARRPRLGRPALYFEPLEDRVTPTTFIWSGLGGNNNWSNPANWLGNAAPSNPLKPDIVFNSATPRLNTTNDLSNLVANSITISASNYALNGNKLLLNGNVTVGAGATGERIGLDLQLTTASSFTINNVADLTVAGRLSGSSTLTKKGVGTMTLTNDNTVYTGAIDVQTGRLVMTNVGALGSTSTATTVEANAQLQISGVAAPIAEPLILNGPGPINDGALFNAAGNSTWSGPITMDSDASFGVAANTSLTVPGLISDTGFTGGHNLTKVGPGQMIFSHVGGNVYRGQTIINNGILTIRDPLSLGAGADATKPQSGTPQSGTTVNFNPTTGDAGTLELAFTSLSSTDPNAILQDPSKPFDVLSNPVIGFQVFNDLLTLNGPGFNNLGALHNLSGSNIWNGGVTLGSPLPNTSDITIGVETNAQLTVSGVVSDDPNRSGTDIPDLLKILPGKLIFDNANTYRGNTIVQDGILTARDSQALGSSVPGTGSVSVAPSGGNALAALEYEVDQGLDGTPQRTHNRNLGFDSVRKTGLWQEIVVPGTSGTFTVSFNGASTAPLAFNATAAQVQAALQGLPTIGANNVIVTQDATVYRVTFANALSNTNVPLLSVTGTAGAVVNNAYGLTVSKNLTLNGPGINSSGALRSVSGLNVQSGTVTLNGVSGSIGVDTDSRPGHPTADNTYFTSDYSLTVNTPDALQSSTTSKFLKFGTGQLILPAANTQLKGPTEIWEGWITVQNNNSLGLEVVDRSKGETVQPDSITVRGGAALHLLPLAGDLVIPNRLILAGQGITHPFAVLEQGALLSLKGNNRATGDIGLTTSLGGGPSAGASQVGIGVDDPVTGDPPGASTLTTTGTISDFVPTAISITGLTASGGGDEQAFQFDTGGISGKIRITYDFLFVPDELRVYYPPRSQGGALIFDSGLINGAGTFNVNYGPGTSTSVEIVMNEGGQDPGTFWIISDITITPNVPPGGNGILKMGSGLLSLQGDGTYTGAVTVQSGALRAQNDSALGRNSSGTAKDPTTQTYTQTQTTVAPGARLELSSTIPQNAGGFTAGVQMWDEHLVLNGAGQQVLVSGSAGTYTLSFNNQTTAPLAYNATAAQMQAALNALSSVGGAGGTATVVQNGSVYTVTFGGALAGLNNPLLVATAGPAPGNVTAIVSGSNYPLAALGEDNLWRGPVTLNTDTTIDVADHTRLTLYGPIDDDSNLSPSGSSLTVGQAGTGDTGELVLSGNNTYRGTTNVKQGILTITNGKALGGIGGAEVQTVTIGGATGGGFTLTFDGKTTAPIAASATATQIQDALNALSTVGGAASVTRVGNLVTITFGGALSGADQPTLVASGSGGTTAVVNTTTDGFGGTVVDMGAQMQIQGSLTIAGESLTLSGSGVGAADVPNGIPIRWSTIGSSPINNAQTAGQNAATGRVTGIAVDPSDPNVIYLSAAGGGAWKTKNGGRTWTPLFDNTAAMFSGAIAVAPSDPRVIYLGTGEGNNSGDSFYGTGVYKSTDSGRTWSLVANTGSNLNPLMGTAVNRIAVDPTNANLIYVATAAFVPFIPVNSNAAPNSVGVWRFNGTSWLNLTSIVSAVRATQAGQAPFTNPVGTPGPDDDYRITFPQDDSAWTDLALVSKPGDNTRVLYAALGFVNGDPNNGVFRLVNPQAVTGSNVQWLVGDPANPFKADNRSANEFPTGAGSGAPRNGVIKVTAVVTNPNLPVINPGPFSLNVTVYAAITDPFSGAVLEVQTTTDGGLNWAATKSAPPNYLDGQGWYDSAIIADPANPSTVYAVGDVTAGLQQVVRSIDGGTTWEDISVDAAGNGPHSDEHAAIIDSQGRLLVGNDGGIWRWDPAKALWTNLNGGGLAITTFNGITTSPINPDFVLGGSQDNGTEKFTGDQAWEHVDDGDGGIVRFDLNDPNIAYHVLNGRLQKSTDGGNTWSTLMPVARSLYFPFVVDPVSSRVVVATSSPTFGATPLQESLDGGATWIDLSSAIPGFPSINAFAIASYQGNRPDGTYQFDPAFPLVGDKGANTYDPDTIYIANGGSRLLVTKDHAQSWVDRTPNLPGIGTIVDVTVDPRNRDTVYVVTQGMPGSGANRVLKSTDAGQTWTDITNNMIDIPGPSTDVPLWKVVIDPRDGTLYLGSDQGVWRLKDGAGSWDRFGAGMPNVQVKELDLNLNLNILTAGTYGRSAFQMHLDDPQADSGAVRATSGLSTWTGPIRLAGDATFGVGGSQALLSGAAAATLDVVGTIGDTGAGNYQVTKDGQGTLIFSGKNTYGGLTEVANGVLGVNNPDALGAFRAGGDITAQGGTVVDAGAALQMQSDLEGEPIMLNGDGVAPGLNGHNSGALRNISGNNTYTGTLTLATNATIGVDSGSQLTIGASPSLIGIGSVAGSPSLTKELTGTLVLASDNSGFSGPTAVIQGAVRLENSNALGTSGAGASVLDGGQIQLRTPTSGPNANQPVVVNAPLTLSGTGIFGSGALLNAGGNNSWNGPINFGILSGFSPDTFPFGTVSINVANPADTLTLGGPIAEFAPTGLTKIGPGELVLRAANGYSGATEVAQGILDARDAGALGTRSSTASVQRIVTLSATKQGNFTLSFGGQSITLNWAAAESQVKTALESLSTIGTGNIASVTRVEIQTTTQNGAGAPQTGYAYTVVFGGSRVNTQTQITASGANGTGASASVVATGGINVRVAAGAALELDSTGSSSPGGFTLAGHKLTVSGDGVGGHGALDNAAGNNGWTGPIEMLTNSSIGAAATTALTLNGGITGSGLDLIKVDPGTVIFPTGGNNQGRTVINAGTVEVDGSIGAVQLAGGTLGGTGSVGAIGSNLGTPGNGGTLSPGLTFPAPAIGILTGSSATLNSSNVIAVDLSNPGSPSNDVLQIVGSIDLGGAQLSGTVAPNVGLGDVFTILTAATVTGHFAGATTAPTESGATSATIAFIDNQKFVVNYFADHVDLNRQLSNVTMALAKTIAAPMYGQSELFLATLTPESPSLQVSGTVIFTVIDPDANNFQFQIPIDPQTGIATFDPSVAIPNGFGSPLQLGTYSVTASYNGLNSASVVTFNPASAGPVQATVSKANTTTGVSSSQTPSMFGATVTFTATVTSVVTSPVAGTLAPNGTVTFRDTTTNTDLGTFALTPGSGVSSTATVSTSALAIGLHSIQATYNPAVGDNYLGSASALFSQIVNKSTTTTTVAGSPNPSTYGQPVTLSATVTGTGVGTPTGTVTFKLGSVILGTGALNASGVATYTTTAFQLPGGLGQVITAVYSSDGNFTSSTGTGTQDVNPIASTTTVISSNNPSGFGQSVTFTATVTPSLAGGAVPTGPVTFILDGATTLGIGTLNTSGIATFNASGAQLSQGAHTITAQYAGSANYAPSSGTVDQTVNVATSATTVSANPPQGVAQRAITFTAHVAPSPAGSGVPTGQVIFTDQTAGGVVLGTATLDANGNAVLVHHVGGPLGNHVIRASYQGDTNYAVSNGSTAVRIIANGTRTSTVTLKSSAPITNVGVPVTFTATVRDTGGFPVANPGGTVMFFDKSVLDPVTNKPVILGYGQLVLVSPGVMRTTFTTSNLTQLQDPHQIRARYSGNGLFARSTSVILSELVKPAPTRGSNTTLTAPQGQSNTGEFGKTLSFTATVTDGGSGTPLTPTGAVTFIDTTTNTVLATVNLTESATGTATATLSTNELNVGTHDIVATYSGDTDFAPPPAAGTTSNALTQTVTQTTSTMTLKSSANPSLVGQAVTFKATLISGSGGGVPTGMVSFFDGGILIGTGAIDGTGVATFKTSTLTVGAHAITATFSGDANFTGSNATLAGGQTVTKAATTAKLTRSTSDANTALTLTATILPVSPATGTPTGTVTFMIDGVDRATVNLSGGVAVLVLPSGLAQGTHSIVIKYVGDGNFNASTTGFTYIFGGRGG